MAVQSKERLNELLEKYRLTGDMNVRNEIVLMYMDLVKMIAVSMRNIYTGYAESDDIINEGVIALMAAIDGFDPEKNVKFETYAGIRIKGAVIDYLRKLDRVPRTLRKLSKQLDDNFARLNSELCRTPTDEELAESMNMTTAQLSKLMANTAGMITLSFEELLYEDNLDENIAPKKGLIAKLKYRIAQLKKKNAEEDKLEEEAELADIEEQKKKKEEKEKIDPKLEAVYHDLEEQMKGILGTKVCINHKDAKKGKLEIEYYSQDELDRIIDMIRTIQK